jgi:hypothetical protein
MKAITQNKMVSWRATNMRTGDIWYVSMHAHADDGMNASPAKPAPTAIDHFRWLFDTEFSSAA